jgi:hypothetical protein
MKNQIKGQEKLELYLKAFGGDVDELLKWRGMITQELMKK